MNIMRSVIEARRSPRPGGSGNGRGGGGGGGGGHVSVNTESWSFYGRSVTPTPLFLVGPVVGRVTETCARVLVEVARTQEVTMEAFIDGERVTRLTMQVAHHKPTVFRIEDLIPGKRVRVKVSIEQSEQEREACFTTVSDKTHWKFGVVSCNCHSRMEPLGLWEKMAKVVGEVDCIVHLGDQVYADMDLVARQQTSASRFNSAWLSCLGIIDLDSPDQWEGRREQLLESYRQIYRLTWNFPPLAQVLASTANYMIIDDHEVVDDLGDEESHTDQSSREFFVIKCAYQVYLEYQKQLLCDVDVTDSENRAYYGVKLGPKVGLFMSDNRVERSIHRSERTDDWQNKTFLGPNQWDALNDAFTNEFRDCDCVLFGAPTPLVFLSQRSTGLAEKVVDDARGTWGHKNFKEEQKALCTTLSQWQIEAPNRGVVTLAGDVHVGGFTDSWHNKCEVPLHQLTSSAVGNLPEGNLGGAKKTMIKATMEIDQRLFPFKVKHSDWIFGPNFGMVDVIVGNGEQRPKVTLTLCPHQGEAKVRNLTFGDSSVDKKKKDQHEASGKAHATVALMR